MQSSAMLERWTRTVLRLRMVILICWLAVLVLGTLSAARLPVLLSNSVAVPGTESETAQTLLAEHFGERTEGLFTVVFRLAHPSQQDVDALKQHLSAAARAVPTGNAQALRAESGVVYGDVETKLDLQSAKGYTSALRRALDTPGFPQAYVTGQPAIQRDLEPILSADLHRGELVAALIALLVMLVVLGVSGAVLIPFAFAACTITATLAVVYALAHEFLLSAYVPNLVGLIGLGLAIDYSLLVVYRFREELARKGCSVEDAIVHTMLSAGRAVVFSGMAVAIGLAVVLIMPVPFVRSLGLAGFLVPLISILAALTLQPALLSVFGRRGMRRVRVFPVPRAHDIDRSFWTRLARGMTRHPMAVLATGTAVLAVAAAPVAFLQLTPGSISAIPQSTESARGLALLRERIGAGEITPIELVVDAGTTRQARAPTIVAATERMVEAISQDPEAYIVATGEAAPYVSSSGRYRRVFVVGRHEFGNEAMQELVRALRSRVVPEARFPATAHVYVGGAPAQGVDFLARVYGAFPWVVLAVLVLTYLMLLRALRSLLLPLVAVLLNLLSVAAAYGLLVVIFRFGVGADTLGLFRIAQVEGWIPVFLFAMLFGLSMDYEVFLVMRMRESWDEVPDNARAVAQGLERTGRVISTAAVVMVAAFSGFVAGRVAGLQEFGAGLAVAVLLDATLVRLLLLPSLITLLGPRSWWLPARVARIVGAGGRAEEVPT